MHTPMTRRAARWIAATLFTTILAACGGGGDSTPAPPAANVGAAGATVSSDDNNASLTVPAGAVSTPINVTLTAATSGYTADPQLVPGSVYKIDAPDTTLAQPAELSITVPGPVAAADPRPRASAAGPGPSLFSLPIVCSADASGCWFADAAGRGCSPPQKNNVNGTSVEYPVLLGYDSNFSSPDSLFSPGRPYNGPASYCARSTPPVPQIVSASGALAALPTLYNPATRIAKAQLGAIKPGYFGALLDTTAPTVKITATILPGASNTATLKLSAVASDNLAVTKVTFEKVTGFQLVPVFQVNKSPIAQFVAGPYEWQSGPLANSDIYGKAYLACAFDAANNKACDFVAPQLGAPVLTGFTATPTTLPNGGGVVTLAWTASDASTLTIDQGVGDVSGQVNASANVSTSTTFTLTATNAIGSTTATTTVTVQPPAAPTVTSFTATPTSLPTGGGSVTLNWATSGGATSLSLSDGTVTSPVTGTSKLVSVTASTTFTLIATNAGGSSPPAQTTVLVAATNDRFVDPGAGLDTNACSQAAPCKTIAKALTGAPVGSTVYLANGSYNASTQPNATLPDGVTLRATNAGAATLAGMALTASGSATLNGLVFGVGPALSCTSLTATSAVGTPTLALTGVLMQCESNSTIGGTVKAVMTPGSLAGGLYTTGLAGYDYAIVQLNGNAELLIQGGVIDGYGATSASGSGLLRTAGNSKLTLDGATVRNRKAAGVSMVGASNLVLQNGTVLDNVGPVGTFAGAVHISSTGSLTMDHAQITNSPGSAIWVDMLPSAPALNFIQSTIANNAQAGIVSGYGFVGTIASITADGLSLTNNNYGIYWQGAAATSFDLRNSTITGNTSVGVSVSGVPGTSFKLRGSTVSGNSVDGVYLSGSMTADLGTAAAPGGNSFSTNGTTGLHTAFNAGQTANAVGNTWTPGQQGADANGRYSTPPSYTPVPKTGPIGGVNFKVDGATSLNL